MPRRPAKPPVEPRKPVVKILVDGKPALTLEMATARAAPTITSVDGMRKEISRHKVPHIPGVEEALGSKKRLYLVTAIDEMLERRPGTGSPGRARKAGGA